MSAESVGGSPGSLMLCLNRNNVMHFIYGTMTSKYCLVRLYHAQF